MNLIGSNSFSLPIPGYFSLLKIFHQYYTFRLMKNTLFNDKTLGYESTLKLLHVVSCLYNIL